MKKLIIALVVCALVSGCLSHSANLRVSRAGAALTSGELTAVKESAAAILLQRGFTESPAAVIERQRRYYPEIVGQWQLVESLGALRGSRIITAAVYVAEGSIRISVGARDDGDKRGVDEVKSLLLERLRAKFPALEFTDESFAYFNMAMHQEPIQSITDQRASRVADC